MHKGVLLFTLKKKRGEREDKIYVHITDFPSNYKFIR